MKRDACQNCSLIQKKTAFPAGISFHFMPFVFRQGFNRFVIYFCHIEYCVVPHTLRKKMETIKPYLNRCGLLLDIQSLVFISTQLFRESKIMILALMWSQSGVIIGLKIGGFFGGFSTPSIHIFFSMIKPDANDPPFFPT